MLFESTSFKVINEFFIFLKKNKIDSSEIKLGFYNGKRQKTFITFKSDTLLFNHYSNIYQIISKCKLGNLVTLERFSAESNIFSYKTKFVIINPTTVLEIFEGNDYDRDRIRQRDDDRNRQKERIRKYCDQYKMYNLLLEDNFYKAVKNAENVYSSCYAEAGWSEGTDQLREFYNAIYNQKEIFF